MEERGDSQLDDDHVRDTHRDNGAPSDHEHHELPASGRALTGAAVSATLHCLTGCAIGEVAGMAIGTALGISNLGTVALSILLAFVFGYGLTSMPLLRARPGVVDRDPDRARVGHRLDRHDGDRG